MDGGTNGWMMDKRMVGWMEGGRGGRRDGWIDDWVNEWVIRWVDGWMGERTFQVGPSKSWNKARAVRLEAKKNKNKKTVLLLGHPKVRRRVTSSPISVSRWMV